MDFIGMSWDILKKGDRFLYAQSFVAANVVNYPDLHDNFFEYGYNAQVGRDNVGNIVHSSAMYMDKFADLNYFVAGGWSRTDPNEFMLGTADNKDGYMAHAGVRYDIDPMGLKLGAEYNWGSKNWIGLTPGHDDLYQSKIATRGNVYEVYGIYDLPMGEAISKYAKTFMRLGYQRYEYNFSGSNDWNMTPIDLDDTAILRAYEMNPVENADQVYLTLEATF
jgi:hypothetical protein